MRNYGMEAIISKTRQIELLNANTVKIQYFNNVIIELEDVMEDYKIYDSVTKNKPFKKLILSGRFTNITPEARKYIQEENTRRVQIITAEALVMTSLHQKMFANIYFSILRKAYPLKVFQKEEAALVWLNQFD